MNIPGYTISEIPIYESARTRILTGTRDEDHLPVVIKILQEEYPSPAEIERFKLEYQITHVFQTEAIVKAYDIKKIQNRYAIILGYIPGGNLAELINEKPLSLLQFLSAAIKIAEIIGKVHQARVIHNDINPSNILYNKETQEIKLIDFGLAVNLKVDWASVFNPNTLIGTLPYISPEQTGRMNRGVDYRTDFYSLGVTLYQLLTRQLPFRSQDPMELVHAHIAMVPKAPHEVDATIPQTISAIVMKLLAKNADDRYLNSNGLVDDLRNCQSQLISKGTITPFALGTTDLFNHFQIREKLYGREKELATLMQTCERVLQGKTELLLVKGYSGIGKSALIHEIQRPLVTKWGDFVSGKFDQFRRNIPYAALTLAFSELVNQILTENETKIAIFREKILTAVKGNGQMLIDIIPNLALIIGKQPPVTELSATEKQNLLSLVFQNLITVLATQDHPLCVFLDDLQWADLPSLKMIETLLTSNCHYLLIIGAYRSNEVGSGHPLISTLENIKKKQLIFETIELGPLKLIDITHLLADTLHQTNEAVALLAEIIHKKTEGNPFFMLQVLETLHKEELITFDRQTNSWRWDLSNIQNKKITDNVVDLLLDKIKQLPSSTQHVLQIAACIGNKFDLMTLSRISRIEFDQIFSILQEILEEGLIIKSGLIRKIPSYQFIHDRIQQAAHSMLREEERKLIHLNIARLLLEKNSLENLKEDIFDIANHYGIALDPEIPKNLSIQEKLKIAEINLQASLMAKSAAAFEPALRYAEACIKCQEEDAWSSHYPLIFSAYVEATENAFLSSEIDLMDRYAAIALEHAKDVFDEIKIFSIQIQFLSRQLDYRAAERIVIQVLKKLGIRLNPNPSKVEVLFELIKVRFRLSRKDIPNLINLPLMTDPVKEAAQAMLLSIFPTTYFNNPNLFIILVCQSVSLSLSYGNSKESGASYGAIGLAYCGFFNEFEKGYELGKLGLNLIEKLNAPEFKPFVVFAYCSFIAHWKEPVKTLLPALLENYEKGLVSSSKEYGYYSNLVYLNNLFVSGGMPLSELLEKFRSFLSVIKDSHLFMNNISRMSIQTFLNLVEFCEEPELLKGMAYNEETNQFYSLEKSAIGTLLFRVNFFKLLLACIFNRYDKISEVIAIGNRHQSSSLATFYLVSFVFYKSLAWLAIYPASSSSEKRAIRTAVKRNQKQMKKWVDVSPVNHAQKYFLVEAEWTFKVLGQPDKAIPLYNQAIEWANKNEHIHEEAVANERLAELYLSQGNEKVARIYLKDARQGYLLWGATAKVAQLDEKYGRLIESRLSSSGSIYTTLSPLSSTISTGHSVSTTLDIRTIQKCSQMISSTIVLDDLLKNLMHLVIENAGAERSFFILSKGKSYLIEAEGSVDQKETKVLQSIEVTDALLPISIINFVINTQESVVLDDARSSDRFAKDSYILRTQPKSVLCIPLQNQGILTGLLYLENNLVTAAFTKNRIDLLNLISSQIAISIDNARLYVDTVSLNEHLGALNSSYERFVPKDFLSLLQKKSIVDVALGDHVERKMSVLFADIRNFTTRSEQMTPEQNFNFINSLLSLIAPIISRHCGFIDKYIGDAIMALFPNSADDAVQCALDMQKTLSEYNLQRPDQEPVRIGIGINTGLLMLGTVGEEHRLGATVISDSVNIASRIESLTKVYNEKILISEETYRELKEISHDQIEKVADTLVKGKSQKVTIYKVS